MIIGVVGISVAAAPQAAEAGIINTTRSNIKSAAIVQQEAEQACTNQATLEGDPVPDFPPGSGNVAQSNECALTQNLEADQNAESGDDLSTNEWEG